MLPYLKLLCAKQRQKRENAENGLLHFALTFHTVEEPGVIEVPVPLQT